MTPFEDRVEVIEHVAVLAERHGLAAVGVAESVTLAAPISWPGWRSGRRESAS